MAAFAPAQSLHAYVRFLSKILTKNIQHYLPFEFCLCVSKIVDLSWTLQRMVSIVYRDRMAWKT